jgi:hypothetical protein
MRAIRTVLLALVAACGGGSSKDIDAMVMVIPDAAPDAPPDAFEPIYDFSCMGNAQGAVSANVQLSGFVLEVVLNGITPDIAPAHDAVVDACKAASDTCVTQDLLDSQTMPANGCPATGCTYTSSMLATGGTALDIYLKVSKGTNRQTFVYPASPVTKNVPNIPAVMLTQQVIQALRAAQIVDQDPVKAILIVRATDCMDAPISDAANPLSFSIKQDGQAVQGTTELNAGDIDPMLAGTFIVFNVPVGGGDDPVPALTEVSAMYKGKALRAHEVKAFPSGTTATQLRPGF